MNLRVILKSGVEVLVQGEVFATSGGDPTSVESDEAWFNRSEIAAVVKVP